MTRRQKPWKALLPVCGQKVSDCNSSDVYSVIDFLIPQGKIGLEFVLFHRTHLYKNERRHIEVSVAAKT